MEQERRKRLRDKKDRIIKQIIAMEKAGLEIDRSSMEFLIQKDELVRSCVRFGGLEVVASSEEYMAYLASYFEVPSKIISLKLNEILNDNKKANNKQKIYKAM